MRITIIVMPPIGKLMKKHHLQVALSVKTPPSNGPATEAMPYMAPMNPVYIGRLTSGTEYATIMSAPENIPALPTPAMARPTMRAIELGAIPQMRLPNSKMPMAMRKTHLMETA